MTSPVTVLTADIVNSSLLSSKELDILVFNIKNEMKKVNAKHSFYRGDSFHALCNVTDSFELALKIRLYAIQLTSSPQTSGVDVRLALGIGTVNEPVSNMSTASGEAFTLSGRELDQISSSNTRLSIRCRDEKLDTAFAAISLLTDFIVKGLSPKQAEVILGLMSGATQMEIAYGLKKSQSTVNKLAQAANWNELEKSILLFKKLTSMITV